MIVSLITKERIYSLTLPEKVSGRYWLGELPLRLSIEARDGQWGIRADASAGIVDEGGEAVAWQALANQSVYTAHFPASGLQARLLVEPVTEDRQHYVKYAVPQGRTVTIGRGEACTLTLDNKFVSSKHARLSLSPEGWHIQDMDSLNGTFVNGRRVVDEALGPGDVVFIMGFKIIIGRDCIAVNNPDGQVAVKESILAPCQPESRGEALRQDGGRHLFYRSPRFMRKLQREELSVDAPPTPQRIEETPVALLLGPAITMGMTALVMALVAINNLSTGDAKLAATIPTLVMSFSMLCGTLLWPTLTRRNDRRKKREAEDQRRDKYRKYLENIREELFRVAVQQKAILTENSPDLGELALRVAERRRNLWERGPGQEDFLRIRVGLGSLPMAADVKFPSDRFSVDDDYLRNELLRLAGEPRRLENVPVCYSVLEDAVSGLVGTPADTDRLAREIMLQMAALHSYDEVKLAVLADERFGAQLGSLRYLPHLWDEAADIRLLGMVADEHKAVSSHLERQLAQRLEEKATLPHYVVLCTGKEFADKLGIVQQLLRQKEKVGFSIIYLAETLRDLPKECSRIVELEGGNAYISARSEPGVRQAVALDRAEGVDLDEMAVQMANIQLDIQQENQLLPSLVTFTDMYGVGKIEHLNALTRWRDNNPTNSLQAPIGINAGGDLMYLDLHEKFHGPHGLVAGMTGSGKSEFIITFILSLAVNYHPHEVAFILIDYKGGGLAGAFEDEKNGIRLPHLSGTITNLDGSSIKRSLVSIQSELRRRQALFNEARKVTNEGTLDIYKYQRMYRNGLVSEPVPHLFIISDEFAELKSQQPEFMDQLISAARIGRSLGVHLILATQKPAGVVDDQIWSNSRFRISLKVQEKADSMDMIKRPDAAALVETGRYYMQVGYNEIFELGQSAWCGAPYIPTESLDKVEEKAVIFVDNAGRKLAEFPLQKAAPTQGQTVPQVVAVVNYLSQLAREERVSAPRLWLPAIPAVITVDALAQKYGYVADGYRLNPIVGEYDDPANQKQGPVTLPLSEMGNLALFGTVGSGKTTLISSMLYALMGQYDARRLNVYIIDLGEETLRAFEKAPQVGGVLLSGDGERMGNLFKLLLDEMATRRKRFSDYEGSLVTYCEKTGQAVPQIVVVLRNYSVFAEQFEEYEEALYQLCRDGSKYGIYFVLTANSAGAIRYRMLQNFKQIITLQLNDRSDYIGLFGSTDGLYPAKIKGRGLVRTDKIYEFQTAAISEAGYLDSARDFCARLAQSAEHWAPAIPVLPESLTAEDIPAQGIALGKLAVGIEKQGLGYATVNLRGRVVYPVLAETLDAAGAHLRGLVQLLGRADGLPVTVFDGAGLFVGFDQPGCQVVAGQPEEAVRLLFQKLVERNRVYKQALSQGGERPRFAPAVCVIAGMEQVLAPMSDDGKDKLRVLLEKAEAAYGVHFILCDTPKGMTALSLEPWYKRHVGGADGVWVGDGFTDQYALKAAKVTSELYQEVEPGFGYVVRKGKPVYTLLIQDREEQADE